MEEIMVAARQISLFFRLNTQTKKDLPIRSSEMGLLIYVCKTEEVKTPKAIAQFFNVTKAMATNMITSLCKNEYLLKENSLDDARSCFIFPTKKAIDLVEATYNEYYKTMSVLQKGLGEKDFSSLIHLLTQANQVLLEEKENG